MIRATGDPEHARILNRALVLDELRNNGTISRTQISRRLGLSKMTVSAIVSDLLDAGIVSEIGEGEAARIGGRKPRLLSLDRESKFVIGVDIGKTNTVVGLSNLQGSLIIQLRVATVKAPSADDVIHQVVALIKRVLREGSVPTGKVVGLGISAAGLVDRNHGVVLFSPDFNWKNVPIAEKFESATGLKVAVDNCTRCMTRGERWYGAAQGVANLFYVNIGYGIGSAFVINGDIYDHNSEFGHLYITTRDVKCDCGNVGCLEAVASGQAIERAANKTVKGRAGEWITAQALAEKARAGDRSATRIFQDAGRYLGRAISLAVNLFNPEKVIVGGGVAQAADLLLGSVRNGFDRHVMPVLKESVVIEQSTIGMDAGVVGAVALALNSFVFHEEYIL